MEEHDYVYLLRPLIVPGLVFLVLYPLVMGGVHVFTKLPSLEFWLLMSIYLIAGLGILAAWVVGKSKRIEIKDTHIVFRSLLGEHILEPKDIRRVAFYFDGKGQEIAQIRTGDEFYYVNEFYFPFPELMSDLENFIQQYGIRSNIESYAGLNE